MKNKGIFLLCSIIFLLFLSAKRDKKTVYNLHYIENNLMMIPGFYRPIINSDLNPRTPPPDTFYLSRFEMTNGMYCYYLLNLLSDIKDSAKYKKALPDTTVWRANYTYNEPYVEYYLRHPAYSDYPVVGISYDQSIEFCIWLTKNYNEWSERKYKKVKFDLPNREEWTGAAYGQKTVSVFPWNGDYLMNKEHQYLANFSIVPQENVYRKTVSEVNATYRDTIEREYLVSESASGNLFDGSLNSSYDVTMPVKSYFPNGYGLYNMAGNVEEIIKEKGVCKGGSWRDTGFYLKNEVEENYTDSTPTSSERGFRIMMKLVK